VIQSFVFTLFYLTKGVSQGITSCQNFHSVEFHCVLEQDTHISTCNHTEMVVKMNPYCGLEQDTNISTCNQTETVVDLNPLCLLEQDTYISTCNQTEMVVVWKPYGLVNCNMSSVTARVTEYLPELYHEKTTSYHQDMYLTYDHRVFRLSISDAHDHTINYDAGHFIAAVLLDFMNLAF